MTGSKQIQTMRLYPDKSISKLEMEVQNNGLLRYGSGAGKAYTETAKIRFLKEKSDFICRFKWKIHQQWI